MKSFDYIILGGGLSGLMLASKLVSDEFFSGKSILILEQNKKTSNDRTWCFWEAGDSKWDSIVATSWSKLEIHGESGPVLNDISPYTYRMIRSRDFYKEMHRALDASKQVTRVHATVIGFQKSGEGYEVRTDGEAYHGDLVFNSIFNPEPLKKQNKYPLILQHFYGEIIQTNTSDLDSDSAKFMDFSIDQKGDTRFMYFLPLNRDTALVEYTVFSKQMLDKKDYEKGVKDYLNGLNIKNYQVLEDEFGVIPMTCYPFFKKNDHKLLHIGTAGGWTKASTGFTFKFTDKYTDAVLDRLKAGMSFQTFLGKTRFWRYDLWLLDIFSRKPDFGKPFFSRLFEAHTIQDILKFLDEETTFPLELKIMAKSPTWPFIKSVLGRIIPKR
jgi:lycopene beta-cyclase